MSRTAELLKNNKKNFVGYFIAALGGVIVQYLVGTTLLVNHLGWNTTSAFWTGYIVSIPVGFFLTKLLAFDAKNSGKTRRELVKYLITIIASGCITVYGAKFSINLLSYWLGVGKMLIPGTKYEFSPAGSIGHFMGMGLSFVFNFIVHKKFTFHETGLWDKVKQIMRA